MRQPIFFDQGPLGRRVLLFLMFHTKRKGPRGLQKREERVEFFLSKRRTQQEKDYHVLLVKVHVLKNTSLPTSSHVLPARSERIPAGAAAGGRGF